MRKLVHFNFTVFVILFFNLSLFGQDNYLSGYIITNNKDTVNGFIMYNDLSCYKFCSFKTSQDNKDQVYNPQDIAAYRLNNGRYYISKTVDLDNQVVTAFVEYLIKGKANIYYLYNGSNHYFIEKENDKIYELTERDSIYMDDKWARHYKLKKHKGKLKALLADCPQINNEINKVNLNHSSLIKLAKDYHNYVCTSERCVIYQKEVTPIKLRYSLFAGASLLQLSFDGAMKINNLPSFNIGGKIEFENVISWTNKLSLYSGVSYFRFNSATLSAGSEPYSVEIDGVNYSVGNSKFVYNQKSSIDVDFKYSALNIPLGVSYTFLDKSIRPYAFFALSNNFVISQNKNVKIKNSVQPDYVPPFSKYSIGIIGGVGLKYELPNSSLLFIEFKSEYNSSLEFKSEYNSDLAKSPPLKTTLFGINLGYTF